MRRPAIYCRLLIQTISYVFISEIRSAKTIPHWIAYGSNWRKLVEVRPTHSHRPPLTCNNIISKYVQTIECTNRIRIHPFEMQEIRYSHICNKTKSESNGKPNAAASNATLRPQKEKPSFLSIHASPNMLPLIVHFHSKRCQCKHVRFIYICVSHTIWLFGHIRNEFRVVVPYHVRYRTVNGA